MIRRAGLTAVALLLAAACSSGKSSSPTPTTPGSGGGATTTSAPRVVETPQPARLAVITSCAANAQHHVEITGTVSNPASAPATYTVQLSIKNRAGKRLYATAASAQHVAPKGSGTWTAATTAPFATGMTCAVTGVSRQSRG